MAIKVINNNDDTWTVWDKATNQTIDIVKFNDSYGFIQTKNKYRLDYNGKTVKSWFENFATAKKEARIFIQNL